MTPDPEVRVLVHLRDGLTRDLVAASLAADGLVANVVPPAADLLDEVTRTRSNLAILDLTDEAAVAERLVGDVLRRGARVLVVADETPQDVLLEALFSGASGQVLLRDTPVDRLCRDVRLVAMGAAALDPRVAAAVLQQWRRQRSPEPAPAPAVMLSPREVEVLRAVAEGLTTRSVGRRLGLSPKTVENHKGRIFSKLGVRTQAHAVSIAMARGLLD